MLVTGQMPTDLPDVHDGEPLHVIAAPELVAASIWIDNWQCMLPVINCCSGLLTPALKQSVLALANSPITLLAMEGALAKTQPMLLRATVFELLRTGALVAPSLHTQRLSLHTILEPAQ